MTINVELHTALSKKSALPELRMSNVHQYMSCWVSVMVWHDLCKDKTGAQSIAGIGVCKCSPLAWDVHTVSIDSTFPAHVWRVTSSQCG